MRKLQRDLHEPLRAPIGDLLEANLPAIHIQNGTLPDPHLQAENLPPARGHAFGVGDGDAHPRQMPRGALPDLPAALEKADSLMFESFAAPDFVEGVSSFLERRDPHFAALGA